MINRYIWVGTLVGTCLASGVTMADSLVIPGIGSALESGRPSYREATFPPPQYNVVGMPEPAPLPSDRRSYRQEYNNFPPAGGRYGGGFLEYVMTGGRPEPVAPRAYAASVDVAPSYAAPAYGAPSYAEPTYAAPSGGLFGLAAPASDQGGYAATTVSPARASLPKGGLPDYAPQPTAGGLPLGYNEPTYAQPSFAPTAYAPAAPQDFGQALFGQGPLGQGLLSQSLSAQPAAPIAGAGPEPAAMNSTYERQYVAYSGGERAGTIVIDTPDKFLYLVQGNGQAIRYGIGVGRPGFSWSGVKTISRKAEWPGWTPPSQMLKRRPDLPRHMVGGEANPLGARAMYLGSSLYRIHGTNEPDTIGTNVSSGCIRMMNRDVIDLYGRVGVGTRVVVM